MLACTGGKYYRNWRRIAAVCKAWEHMVRWWFLEIWCRQDDGICIHPLLKLADPGLQEWVDEVVCGEDDAGDVSNPRSPPPPRLAFRHYGVTIIPSGDLSDNDEYDDPDSD